MVRHRYKSVLVGSIPTPKFFMLANEKFRGWYSDSLSDCPLVEGKKCLKNVTYTNVMTFMS